MLWLCPSLRTISKLKKNVHGDHTAPSAKSKKKALRIGTASDRKISKETTIHKTHSTPELIMSLTNTQSRSGLRREWDEKMECLNAKYNLDYYSISESNSEF